MRRRMCPEPVSGGRASARRVPLTPGPRRLARGPTRACGDELQLGKGLLGKAAGWFPRCLTGDGGVGCVVPPRPTAQTLAVPPALHAPAAHTRGKRLPVQLLSRALICLNVVAALSASVLSQTKLFWLEKAKILSAAPQITFLRFVL